MQTHKSISPHGLTHEERAYFSRLAALNAFFESARAGNKAQQFGHRAVSSDAILETFLQEIKLNKQN